MNEPSSPSPPQDPSIAVTAKKKGLSPLMWVLIILGIVFVLTMGACVACGLVVTQMGRELARDFESNPAKAMAELAVRVNPDVELVDSDDDAGTMTVRNTETGEELTLNFEDIADGRFSITIDEGAVAFDSDGDGGVTVTGPDGAVSRVGALDGEDLPDWPLLYPDAAIAPGGFRGATAEGIAGAFQMSAEDPCSQVSAYFTEALPDGGFRIMSSASSAAAAAGSRAMIMLQAAMDDPRRSITITMIDGDDGGCNISVQFGGTP
jgi:hypothetical protein